MEVKEFTSEIQAADSGYGQGEIDGPTMYIWQRSIQQFQIKEIC